MQSDFGWGIVGVLLGALVTGAFGWLSQRAKGQSDQSIAVLEQWSELNGALSTRLATVEKEFADYQQRMSREIEDMRKHHADELDEMRRKHRAEMRTMRDLNEGLQRMIAQNSQSTAHLMGDLPKDDDGEG